MALTPGLSQKSPDPADECEVNSSEPVLESTIEWRDGLLAHARELVRQRDLLLLLTQREITVRYKQTVLGTLWAIIQPFSLMVVLTVFFSLFLQVKSDGIPYPLFSYSGLLPWTFFSTAATFAVPSLITNAHIITKVYFPREVVPLASVLAALVDFGVAAIVFLGMLVYFQVWPTWNVLWVLPLLAVLVIFTTGFCLLLSGLTMVYRDLRFTLPLLIQIWMFATPVLYPISAVPDGVRELYLLMNPVAVVVDGIRRTVVQGLPLELHYLGAAAAISFALLWFGYGCFKRLERTFADLA